MRAFIGIPVHKKTQLALQQAIQTIQSNDWASALNWFPPKNYHLTLQFLGSKNTPEKMQQVMESMPFWFAEGMSYFDAEILRIQPFPSNNNAKYLVASLDNTLLMQHLKREIQEQLKPIGFTPEKQAFRPHISLAKITQADQLPSHFKMWLEDTTLNVDCINLYESKFGSGFPEYSVLSSVPLERYD